MNSPFKISQLENGHFVIKRNDALNHYAILMRLNSDDISKVINLIYDLGQNSKEREIHAKSQKLMDKFGI